MHLRLNLGYNATQTINQSWLSVCGGNWIVSRCVQSRYVVIQTVRSWSRLLVRPV